jgi:hypothetical protein
MIVEKNVNFFYRKKLRHISFSKQLIISIFKLRAIIIKMLKKVLEIP